MSLSVGKIIEGKTIYRIVQALGEGGMSKVWLAVNPTTNDYYVVKEASLSGSGESTNLNTEQQDEVLEILKHESQVLSRLEHSNLAKFIEGVQTQTDPEEFFKTKVLQWVQEHAARVKPKPNWDPFIKEIGASPEFANYIRKLPTQLDVNAFVTELISGAAWHDFIKWKRSDADLRAYIKQMRAPSEYYLVMQYIEGDDLYKRMVGRSWQPMLQEDVLHWMHQVMNALDYCHHFEHAIIHRDIKPSNIAVDRENNAYLLDFGIAAVTSAQKKYRAATPRYRAPQQIPPDDENQPMPEPDVRDDIYSLGATLYALLTGMEPWDAQERREGRRLPAPHLLNSDIDKNTSEAILRAMALDRHARFNSIGEMREQLLPQAGAEFRKLYQAGLEAEKEGSWSLAEEKYKAAKQSTKDPFALRQVENALENVGDIIQRDKLDLERRVELALKAAQKHQTTLALALLQTVAARDPSYAIDAKSARAFGSQEKNVRALHDALKKRTKGVSFRLRASRPNEIHLDSLQRTPIRLVRMAANKNNTLYVLWENGEVQAYDKEGHLTFSTPLFDSPLLVQEAYDLCPANAPEETGCYVLALRRNAPSPEIVKLDDDGEKKKIDLASSYKNKQEVLDLLKGARRIAAFEGQIYLAGNKDGNWYLCHEQAGKLVCEPLPGCREMDQMIASHDRLFWVDLVSEPTQKPLYLFYRYHLWHPGHERMTEWRHSEYRIHIAPGLDKDANGIFVYTRTRTNDQDDLKVELLDLDDSGESVLFKEMQINPLAIAAGSMRLFVLDGSKRNSVRVYDPSKQVVRT